MCSSDLTADNIQMLCLCMHDISELMIVKEVFPIKGHRLTPGMKTVVYSGDYD